MTATTKAMGPPTPATTAARSIWCRAFQAGADQPVWFDEPRFFMDHKGVSLGKPGTAAGSTSPFTPAYTVRRQPVLWYPDRKFFLLGKYLPASLW